MPRFRRTRAENDDALRYVGSPPLKARHDEENRRIWARLSASLYVKGGPRCGASENRAKWSRRALRDGEPFKDDAHG